MNPYGLAVAAAVGAIFVPLAVSDARTGKVPLTGARLATTVAIAGLGIVAVASTAWFALAGAAVGAGLVTGIQLIPYWLQRRSSRDWIGRADVRLAIPFGWTLGWFGLWYAIAGFATALLSGLAASAVTRQARVRFVPFLAIGLWAGLSIVVVTS